LLLGTIGTNKEAFTAGISVAKPLLWGFYSTWFSTLWRPIYFCENQCDDQFLLS